MCVCTKTNFQGQKIDHISPPGTNGLTIKEYKGSVWKDGLSKELDCHGTSCTNIHFNSSKLFRFCFTFFFKWHSKKCDMKDNDKNFVTVLDVTDMDATHAEKKAYVLVYNLFVIQEI